MSRDWDKFWTSHRNQEVGVYGAANEQLLQHAKTFMCERKGILCLDVGAGDGRYSIPLARMGYTVTAMDISVCIIVGNY